MPEVIGSDSSLIILRKTFNMTSEREPGEIEDFSEQASMNLDMIMEQQQSTGWGEPPKKEASWEESSQPARDISPQKMSPKKERNARGSPINDRSFKKPRTESKYGPSFDGNDSNGFKKFQSGGRDDKYGGGSNDKWAHDKYDNTYGGSSRRGGGNDDKYGGSSDKYGGSSRRDSSFGGGDDKYGGSSDKYGGSSRRDSSFGGGDDKYGGSSNKYGGSSHGDKYGPSSSFLDKRESRSHDNTSHRESSARDGQQTNENDAQYDRNDRYALRLAKISTSMDLSISTSNDSRIGNQTPRQDPRRSSSSHRQQDSRSKSRGRSRSPVRSNPRRSKSRGRSRSPQAPRTWNSSVNSRARSPPRNSRSQSRARSRSPDRSSRGAANGGWDAPVSSQARKSPERNSRRSRSPDQRGNSGWNNSRLSRSPEQRGNSGWNSSKTTETKATGGWGDGNSKTTETKVTDGWGDPPKSSDGGQLGWKSYDSQLPPLSEELKYRPRNKIDASASKYGPAAPIAKRPSSGKQRAASFPAKQRERSPPPRDSGWGKSICREKSPPRDSGWGKSSSTVKEEETDGWGKPVKADDTFGWKSVAVLPPLPQELMYRPSTVSDPSLSKYGPC